MSREKQPSVRRLDWHYMAMQMGFWAMFAAIVAYQTALLLERGFTNGEAGLMTSVRCLAGIVFQPLLGGFADRHPRVPLKGIVGVSLILSLAAGLWYWADPAMGLGQTALVWVVIGGLGVSSYPLMDAMAVQFINDGVPIRYSLGRGLGSMAYAVVCVLLGLQVGRWGVETPTPPGIPRPRRRSGRRQPAPSRPSPCCGAIPASPSCWRGCSSASPPCSPCPTSW